MKMPKIFAEFGASGGIRARCQVVGAGPWLLGTLAGVLAIFPLGTSMGTQAMDVPQSTLVAQETPPAAANGSNPAAAENPSTSKSDFAQATARLEQAIKHECETRRLPALSVALVADDRVVWASGFGQEVKAAPKAIAQTDPAKVREPRQATAQTIYRVGEVGELLTALAVRQLVEQGQLDLDAPVQKYLPDFQPEGSSPESPITLRHLLTHRAALVREPPVGNRFDTTEPTLAATVASLNQTRLTHPADTRTKNSPAGIAVLARVVEQQTGQDFASYVQKTILEPLGMQATSLAFDAQVRKKLASGELRTYEGRRLEAPCYALGTVPTGNLTSSVNDLAQLLRCLLNRGQVDAQAVLSREAVEQIVGDQQRYAKSGSIGGHSACLVALPEARLGVVMAASLDGSQGLLQHLADYAVELMLAVQNNQPLPEYPLTSSVEQQRARQLSGKYREVGGRRYLRLNELTATEGTSELFLDNEACRIEVRASADSGLPLVDDLLAGRQELTLLGLDQIQFDSVVYQRTDEPMPPDVLPEWRGLIGEYGVEDNALLLLEDEGQLIALVQWFYYCPLRQIGEDRFVFAEGNPLAGEPLEIVRTDKGGARGLNLSGIRFERRHVGPEEGKTYTVPLVKPIEELRAGAMAATPPAEQGDFYETNLVEVANLDPTIKLDIRYASTNNFTGTVFYNQARAFLQKPVAEAVVRANRELSELGLGLMIQDAYRPWFVSKMFWDAKPEHLKAFVANPLLGSRHNRGCAVDLTIYDLKTGEPVDMVATYDEFTPRAYPAYPGGTARQRWYRDLLRRVLEDQGFTVYPIEWWHFDYKDWKKYRIGNTAFENM